MIDVRIDEPTSLQPEKKRRSEDRTWLIRGVCLTLHLVMIGAVLAWFYVPKFSAWFRPAAPAPRSIAGPAPDRIPAPSVALPSRTRPSSTPGPGLARKGGSPSTPSAPSRSKGDASEKLREGGPSPDNDRSPQEVLEALGLVRSNEGYYALRAEARAADLLAESEKTIKQGSEVAMLLEQARMIDENLSILRQNLAVAEAEVTKANDSIARLPRPITNVDYDHLDWAKGVLLECKNVRTNIQKAIAIGRERSPAPALRKKWSNEKERLEEAYRKQIAELRGLVDSTEARYRSLANDQAVKAALERLGGSAPGPSGRFRAITRGLTSGEEYIRTH